MKNDSIIDKLQMQEQELKVAKKPLVPEIEPNEKQRRVNVGTDIQPNSQTFAQSNDQPAEQSINHSGQNVLSSLFSILPTAADVNNPNQEAEQPLKKVKKKKKGRSLG